jgi:hypothetical protein
MPWCPSCKTEYRAGFENCADCGAPLVIERPAAGAAADAAEPAGKGEAAAASASPSGWIRAVTILDGPADPDAELEILTGRFAEGGLEFQVEEVVETRSRKRAGIPSHHPEPWFVIHVREADAERAKEIVHEEAKAAQAALREAFADALEAKGAPAAAPGVAPAAPEGQADSPAHDSPLALAAKIILFLVGILALAFVAHLMQGR